MGLGLTTLVISALVPHELAKDVAIMTKGQPHAHVSALVPLSSFTLHSVSANVIIFCIRKRPQGLSHAIL